MRQTCFPVWIGFIVIVVSPLSASGGFPNGDDFYVATRWQTKEGLPQNSINSIAQTPDGYLWMGTFNGLVRFDGVRFKVHTVGNTPELRSDQINILQVGTEGSLWIGTGGGGLIRYRDGSFERVTAAEGMADMNVMFLLNDGKGRLWVGTTESVFRGEGGRFSRVCRLTAELRTFSRMAFDREENLWLSTVGGFVRLSDTRGAGTESAQLPGDLEKGFCDLTEGVWKNGRGVRVPGETLANSPSRLMVVEGGAIWTFDAQQRSEGLTLTQGGESWSFRSNPFLNRHDINSFYADREGNLWVGLDGGGLVRLRPKRVRTFSMAQGLPSENTVTMAQDQEGKLWLGRLGGKRGMSWLYPREGRVHPEVESFKNQFVSSCFSARDGTIWVGTVDQGLFSWRNGMAEHSKAGPLPHLSPANSMVRVLFEDKSGGFWIGTDGQGLKHFRNEQTRTYGMADGLAHDRVTALAEDQDGSIWIGTAEGLNRLRLGKPLETFTKREGLRANGIHCLFVDRDGVVWVGTSGGGLSMFTGERPVAETAGAPRPRNSSSRNHFLTLTTREGLLDDVVAQILQDDTGDLWIGTNRGIARVKQKEIKAFAEGRVRFVQSLNYGSDDGMVSEECGGGFQPACLKDPDGHLWFCTVGGPVMIDPSGAVPSANVPQVYVEEAASDGTNIGIGREANGLPVMKVPPGTRTLEIRFTGIEFGAPEKVAFRYRMEGYDEDWVDAGTRRSAFYTRLPPGRRAFEVIARNNGGIWNQVGTRMVVSVEPAFWQTAWFQIGVAAGALALAWGGYHWRVRGLKRERVRQAEFSRRLIESQESERKRIAAELHDGLGQRLLVIKNRAFLASSEPAPSTSLQEHLSDIREVAAGGVEEVREIAHALRPAQLDRLGLTRTIRSLAAQVARANDFDVDIQVDDLDGFFSPQEEISLFRVVQESLNNIVRHARASRVEVRIQRNKTALTVRLSDDGRGFDLARKAENQSGLGLAGLRERAEMLGGVIEIDSAPGRGTRLHLTVPLSPENHPKRS